MTMSPPQMTADLRQQLDVLGAEVGSLRSNFDDYEALFGRSRERIDLLNEVAPAFFGMLFDVLWADMLMHLARLTGSERTGRPPNVEENLSLRRLPLLVTSTARDDVKRAVDAAVAKADFAKAPRNKLYAHRDLRTALTSSSPAFDLGSRIQMREAIHAAEVALQEVARAYGERTAVCFPHWGYGTAEDLVDVVAEGVEAQRRNGSGCAGQGPPT